MRRNLIIISQVAVFIEKLSSRENFQTILSDTSYRIGIVKILSTIWLGGQCVISLYSKFYSKKVTDSCIFYNVECIVLRDFFYERQLLHTIIMRKVNIYTITKYPIETFVY